MSDDFFDNLDRLRVASPCGGEIGQPSDNNKTRPRPIRGEFLKGPVPLTWLSAASKLPGKSPLAVGLALWFEAGRRRSLTVTLTSAVLARFGVDRKGKYRGLASLERAWLVEVVRVPRRNPQVTIIEAHPPSIQERNDTLETTDA
jgi:hypothetical protein